MSATPTRVRQLIGGVWKYVTADEGGGGGSQTFKTVRVSVDAIDVVDGPVLVYDTGADEVVLGAMVESFVPTSSPGRAVALAPLANVLPCPILAAIESDGDEAFDTPKLYSTIIDGVFSTWQITSEALYAGPTFDVGAGTPLSRPWQANHAYLGDPDAQSLVEAGVIWVTSSAGTSGGSKPDFAGNIGGAVADGPDIVWSSADGYVPSSEGQIVAILLIATPA